MELRVLDRDQCLRLLAEDEIGRLAVIAGNTPAMFPVNYALDGDTIVFRTDPGTKLAHGPRARASFEVDRFDHAGRAGWSVVATGRLEEVTHYDAATFARVRRLRQGSLDAPDPRSHHRSADRPRCADDPLGARRNGAETDAMKVVMTRRARRLEFDYEAASCPPTGRRLPWH
jgi:nitroimidazol reductase NimA-like FMN-containing flavoprotein (pyridoxamine 5'-phosphate oxidase superfamily)